MSAAPPLPVSEVLPALRAALSGAGTAVLVAPPGSGKTTAVPPALLGEAWLGKRRILMLEPRRLAARAAAARLAWMLGEPLGQRVGYSVRFESVGGRDMRIEVVTEGVLLRRLQRDPALEDVSLLVLDEFHERSLEADLSLALVLDSRRALREDLRVLVMSATLDARPVARLLGEHTPVIEAHGRVFPVDIRYLERVPEARTDLLLANGVRRALAEHAGDLLVFAPGAGEIRRVVERLADLADDGVAVYPLYGDLPREQQDKALLPDAGGRRRVIVATNIAETSLTIEGVSVVVDAGLAREPRFDPDSGLERLQTVRISRASAAQRAGRAGRLGPGVCLRLWTPSQQATLLEHTPPAIASADLAPLALEIAAWGANGPEDLAWLDPPPAGGYAAARVLLASLGALETDGRISRVGRAMAKLPVHPRLARMLLAALEPTARGMACDLAALLSERDPLRDAEAGADVAARLAALSAWRSRRTRGEIDAGACARIDRVSKQLRHLLDGESGLDLPPAPADPGAYLSLAWPDRIAQRRGIAGDEVRYRLAGGRAARLSQADPLAASPLIAVARLDARAADGRVWLAAALDEVTLETLHGERIRDESSVAWDERAQAVTAERVRCLDQLVLSRKPMSEVPSDDMLAAMLEGVRRMGLDALPWSDAARSLRARVQCLSEWLPDHGWPDLGDTALVASLDRWLAAWLGGISRRDHLARLDMLAVMRALLGPARCVRLESLAPTHLAVPSGARRTLKYLPGQPPVLAVKLQEMFGCTETPRVAGGRVPVTLHLLSPAGRPVQITDDLPGFWQRGYAEVRKDLRGRYPRHPWPEDPLAATPTARARPRGRTSG